MIARLVNLVHEVSPKKKLLLTADRGFGRATFIQFLLRKKLLFVIRVRGDLTIKTNKGKSWLLRKLELTLTPETPLWFKDLKSQLGIADLQTRNLLMVRRIILMSCVSYAIAMLVGTLVHRFKTVKESLISFYFLADFKSGINKVG